MRGCIQQTHEQRYQIQALLKTEHRDTEIARVVGIHPSTISPEVRRNRGLRGYRPQQACRLTLTPRYAKARPRIPAETWRLVDQLLREQWSPEQISGQLRQTLVRRMSHKALEFKTPNQVCFDINPYVALTS